MPEFPHSAEAEEAVIGSVLINPNTYHEVSWLKGEDFYIHRNGFIWEAFGNLVRSGAQVDMVTVSEELDRSGKLEEVGGFSAIMMYETRTPSSLNVCDYAQIVKSHSHRRAGIALANKLAAAAYDESQEFDASAFASQMIGGARVSSRKTGREAIAELWDDLYTDKTPLTFGVSDLDERLGGLFAGELTVLGGDQGTGKTAFFVWTARKNVEQGKRVLLVSLEMKAKSVYARMACGDLGVNWNQVRAGRVTPEVKEMVWEKAQLLERNYRDALTIYEDPMTLYDIQSAAHREGADLVGVDHMGLISGIKSTDNTVVKIDIMNGINRFLRQSVAKSKDKECHVMLLWQIGKASKREKRRPTKDDLFMAGTQDPDSIIMLYRPDLYDEEKQMTPPTAPVDLEVIASKARNDFTGIVSVKYDLQKQAFYGLSRKER